MSDVELISSYIKKSSEVKTKLISQKEKIKLASDFIVETIKSGGRIYSCGNGGSACDAMHFIEELVARYKKDRPGIAAHNLLDTSTITCWANDYDFSTVFSRQVETLVTNKDLLVVFSTSGNSQNILKALDSANKINAKSLALLGKDGGQAKDKATHSIIVESNETAHIQECHITLVHIFCEIIETHLHPL